MLAKISVGAVILVLRVKQKVKSFVVLSYLREEKRRNNRHTNVSIFQYLSDFLHATLSQHFLLCTCIHVLSTTHKLHTLHGFRSPTLTYVIFDGIPATARA